MNNDIIIIPLGTISPYCKKNMNCPGFLIKYHEYNILLDCGNGITRYMSFPQDLKNLNVFISHMHEDHYGDLSSIMFASLIYKDSREKDKYTNIYTPVLKNGFLEERFNILSHPITEELIYHFHDLKISFYDNKSHGIECYMIKLDNGKNKIVYTSDIGISNINGIINFANNSDIFICESTIIKRDESSLDTHFSASEAAKVAKEANVKKLLLTHFNPELDKKEYLIEARNYFENTEVAEECKKLVLR